MKNILILIFSCAAITSSCAQEERDNNQPVANGIFPKGAKITNDNFKGTAYLKMLMDADSLNPTSVGNVTFEPGARTKWHAPGRPNYIGN